MSRYMCGWIVALAVSGCLSGGERDADWEAQALTGQDCAPDNEIEMHLTLRDTARVTLRLHDYEGRAHRGHETVLAVPGFVATGATFQPLARAILSDAKLRTRVKRVITIDFPGHGQSGLPEGLRFSDLTIDDQVSLLLQTLGWLEDHDRGPDVVIGHSLGGLLVPAAQQQLLAAGSSLAQHGVHDVALLAPVPPHAQPWTVPDVAGLSGFIVSDPALGQTLQLPPPVWVSFVFATRAGQVAAGAPAPEDAQASGYIAFEAAGTLLQLTEASLPLPGGGTLALERPSVQRGAFASAYGTRLNVVSFSEDSLVPADNVQRLATYLSGDEHSLRSVVAANAAHGLYISDPQAVVAALCTSL